MKYYSEKTRTFYDEEKDLVKAEQEYEVKLEQKKLEIEEQKKKEEVLKAERGLRAKEVEEAFAKAEEVKEIATKLLNDFLKDYGSYHSTIKSTKPITTFNWLFDSFNREVDNFLKRF